MIRRTLPGPLPLELETAVQAALDERREVLADPEVERVLTERPKSLGPLLAWLAVLASVEPVPASVEHDAPALPRSRGAGLATAAGLLVAAGLLLLATRLHGPHRAQAPTPAISALEVHDFSITVTRSTVTHNGPTRTRQLVNDNGRLTRVGEWTPTALAQAGQFPPAVHSLQTHISRRIDLR